MNLPFALPVIKETGSKKKEDYTDAVVQYERKLAEYKEVLETYRKYIREYSIRLEGYERKFRDSHLDNIQSALDMTYLKEQGDKTVEILHQLKAVSGKRPPDINLDQITKSLAETDKKLDALENDLKTREENLSSLSKSMLTMAISLDNMDKRMDTLSGNVDGLDKNVVNRITEFLLELQKQHIHQNGQLQAEVVADVEKLNQTVNKNKVLLWFILIFNFFGLTSIVFLVLYYLEIIPL